MKRRGRELGFFVRHSLSIAAVTILVLWLVLYCVSDPKTHFGAFFGNAIADWTGVVVIVFATKHLYERGSVESKEPPKQHLPATLKKLRDHSLTIFLAVSGIGWVMLFARSDPESKWGEVAGNIVSEWTQILGLVLLTKRLIELHSKESKE